MNQSSTLRASKTTIALNKVKTFFSKPHNVILLLLGILYFIRAEFVQLFGLFTVGMLLSVIGTVIAAGVGICVVSTYFVVNRLVSLQVDELYY